jgi:hypothetical protein
MDDELRPVTAIDVLLDPDATMIRHAEAANERLRKSIPEDSLWIRPIERTSRFCSGRSRRRTSKKSTTQELGAERVRPRR